MSRTLDFGLFVTPSAANLDGLTRIAALADGAEGAAADGTSVSGAPAFDFIALQDHPYQPKFLDVLALSAHLLAITEQVRVITDVANLPLRPPAVLAKTAASLDVLSGGRFELGLGAGGYWEAIEKMGGPVRTPGEAVDALDEGIDVIRAMWSGKPRAQVEGTFYSLDGVNTGPKPAHNMGIWLGAMGPRMLRLVGAKADGWLPSLSFMTPEKLRDASQRIDAAASAAGRDPGAVRRGLNVFLAIESDADVREWTARLADLVDEFRFDALFFGVEGDSIEQYRRIAADLVPALREA